MPDINLIIDGQPISVPAGTNIIDAARMGGVAIPVFCYHPKMKPVGMCRMCMVEVWTPRIDPATRQVVMGEDGKPQMALMMNKLQPGCVTPVSEGMEVRTVTDKVKFAQKGMLEFLLTSHPLDCPVCDKGGECPLQNLTMQWGPGLSRFDYADKVHFEKPVPLGDLIYLDRERCILCSRCVRFQDDLAGDQVLGFDNRGRNWEIIAKGNPPFDSKFSGNTTDICPVGALTTADFRFKARVWELQPVPGVCNHCPVGCNLTFDMRHNKLMRVMPRENSFVNEIWLCDKGRFGMRAAEQSDRITTPLIRRGERMEPASWEEALGLVAERMAGIQGTALAGLVGPNLSNEDYFAFGRLLRESFGSHNLDYRAGAVDDPAIDTWTEQYGVGSGTNLIELGKGTAVLVLGADPEEEAPLYVIRLRNIQARGGDITVINPYPTKLGKSANRSITPRPGAGPQVVLALVKTIFDEGLTKDGNLGGRIRGLAEVRAALADVSIEALCEAAGVSADMVRAAARSFAAAENGIVIYGGLALRVGAALLDAAASLLLACGMVGRANSGMIGLTEGGNARGAIELGLRPESGKQSGLAARDLWAAIGAGKLRGMYVAGSDPTTANPAALQALDSLEFLVVQDMFMTETARRADVVLPLPALAETEGSLTNAERRVQRFRQAMRPDADIRPVWEVAQTIGQLVQDGALVHAGGNGASHAGSVAWPYAVAEDVTDAIAQSVRGYAAAAPANLSNTSGAWGRQTNEQFYYDGTSYENTEGVGVQLASGAEDPKRPLTARVQRPANYGTGLRMLAVPRAYDNGNWGRGSKLEPRMVPAHVILSVSDAQELGVGIGEMVTVRSEQGSLTLRAQIDSGLAAGTVLVPRVQGSGLGMVTTGGVTLVTLHKA